VGPLVTRTAYRIKSREHHDVVQVSVSSCIVGATTGDQPQSGMVDLAVNRLSGEPRLGESGHPGDSEDGSFPIVSGNGHLISAPQGVEAVKDSMNAIPSDVPGDNGRPERTRCGPSSEPASVGRVVWRLHRSILEPKVDQPRLDTNSWYRHGNWVRFRENQTLGLVAKVGLIRSCRRSFGGGLGRAGRRGRRALIIRRWSESWFGGRRSC
jgi:hypothetical protein